MAFSNSLYIADEGTLPAELPSVEQIESASEIFGDTTGRKVVGVGIHFIVKYGVQVDTLEGRTMIFLGQSTHIPVPQVYALFQSPEKDVTYIIMERIRGWNLNSKWLRMDQASKEIVSTKLRNVFEEMRKLETPGGYCSVGHGGLPDGLFWTNNPSNPFAGPFNTESELNKAMIAKYVENGLSTYKANFYSRTFQDVFQNHSPVFSHADFQRKNVLIRTSTTTTPTITTGKEEEHWSVDNLELVIIDWEFSGWYPSYWEYARAVFACGRWNDDWNDWIDQILKPYRNEYAWVEILLRELWS